MEFTSGSVQQRDIPEDELNSTSQRVPEHSGAAQLRNYKLSYRSPNLNNKLILERTELLNKT